jgi:hypothetical protein
MRESIASVKHEIFSCPVWKGHLMSEHPVLIIGGGGKTGGRVNARLRARGIATRAVSRSTAISFDWNRREN